MKKCWILVLHEAAHSLFNHKQIRCISKCWFVIERLHGDSVENLLPGIPKVCRETKKTMRVSEIVQVPELAKLTYFFGYRLLGPRTHLPALTLQPPHTLLTPL